MKISIMLFVLLLMNFSTQAQVTDSTVKRDTVFSKLLNEDREISVYLPPSYYASNQSYPVLYFLDGDYNFFYVSGFVELQSAISENIPEMILVGISGKGTSTYRKNCKPNATGRNDSGNAETYADFIEKELVPFVDKNYKTLDYKILAGHSIGGLFVINTVLNKPNVFNNYIAISPALWWEKNLINDMARDVFKANPDFSSKVYVSLADEKGMGVDKFLDVVQDSKVKKGVFEYKHFPEENHNSVGLFTYNWALKDIFKIWKGESPYFNKVKHLKEHHERVMNHYGHTFNMQAGLLGYTVYINRKKQKELAKFQQEMKRLYPKAAPRFDNTWALRFVKQGKEDQAIALLETSRMTYPSFFDNHNELAKLYLKKEQYEKAAQLIEEGLKLAYAQKTRQWKLNELIDTKERIVAARK